MTVDLKALIGKLNAICRQRLETAAGLCVSQTNYHVETEHLLMKLLVFPDNGYPPGAALLWVGGNVGMHLH